MDALRPQLSDDVLLHGRKAERLRLSALLETARAGASAVLVVRGEAGIGKSTLVADAVAHARGMRVLQAAGAESESGLAFAGIHGLLRPVVDLVDGIPRPQARALRSALGLAAPGGDDPLFVGAGVLSVLALASEERPLLCVVDDAHWLDAPSARVLTFAARRLEAEPIAFVFVARDDARWPFDTPGLPELRLEGLERPAAAALLSEHAGPALAPGVLDRLVDEAAGNPLVLRELPRALSEEQLAGQAPLPDPLPLTGRLEESFWRRAALLTERAQTVLLVAAVDNTGDPAVVLRAAEALGARDEDVEEAETSGLLRLEASRIELRHPLVRSALYQGAGLPRRRAVHLALAESITDEGDADRRAWHVAAATVGPNEEVAAELERSAERARARGGHASAAVALARAASLAEDDERRAARRLAAAEAAWLGGQRAFAAELVQDVRSGDALLRADAERLRGSIELAGGSPRLAYEVFLAAASEVEALDLSRAAQLLLDAAVAAVYGGDRPGQVEVGRRAERLLAASPSSFELLASAGLGRLWGGDAAGARPLVEAAISAVEETENPRRFFWAAVGSLHLGDEGRGRSFALRDAELARRRGAVTDLVSALSRLAFAEIAEGRLASAAVNASEGLALAAGAGLENDAGYHRGLLAWIAALLGRAEEALEHAEAALEPARARERGWQAAVASVALGELELVLGRPAAALGHFEALSTAGSLAMQPYLSLRVSPSTVEAAVREGRTDLAAAVTARFAEWATATGAPANLALLERCRALLADEGEAEAHFEQALRLYAEVARPFEQARTELLYGECLRRAGRRRDAREHLRTAVDLFGHLHAHRRAEQAAAELRASGQTLRRRGSQEEELTPQELQIARIVAAGVTNKEVAAQLFLSPRTVDAHLRNVFRKLGLTSRGQLALLYLGDPGEADPSAKSPMRG